MCDVEQLVEFILDDIIDTSTPVVALKLESESQEKKALGLDHPVLEINVDLYVVDIVVFIRPVFVETRLKLVCIDLMDLWFP